MPAGLVIVFVIEAETGATGLADIGLHSDMRSDLDLDADFARLRCEPLRGADINTRRHIFATADRRRAGCVAATRRVEIAAGRARRRRAEQQPVETEPT